MHVPVTVWVSLTTSNDLPAMSCFTVIAKVTAEALHTVAWGASMRGDELTALYPLEESASSSCAVTHPLVEDRPIL